MYRLVDLMYRYLQKPHICLAECWEFPVVEIGYHLRDHFGIGYGDGEVLLLDGFPVHAAELIDLFEYALGIFRFYLVAYAVKVFVDSRYSYADREKVIFPSTGLEVCFAILCIVIHQILKRFYLNKCAA